MVELVSCKRSLRLAAFLVWLPHCHWTHICKTRGPLRSLSVANIVSMGVCGGAALDCCSGWMLISQAAGVLLCSSDGSIIVLCSMFGISLKSLVQFMSLHFLCAFSLSSPLYPTLALSFNPWVSDPLSYVRPYRDMHSGKQIFMFKFIDRFAQVWPEADLDILR